MLHRYIETGMTTVVYEDKNLIKSINNKRQGWNNYKKTNSYSKLKKGCVRYFNQNELERLQTVPRGYTKSLTRNQAACLLGDGWTIDVIAHIFSFMINNKNKK